MLGGVYNTPKRATDAETYITGKAINATTADAAGKATSDVAKTDGPPGQPVQVPDRQDSHQESSAGQRLRPNHQNEGEPSVYSGRLTLFKSD